MRAAKALTAMQDAIARHFNEANDRADVAKAITSDQGMVEFIAKVIADRCATPEDVDQVIAKVAAQVDDRTADWLVSERKAPTGWLYGKVINLF